jgi:hypothetical protein
MKNIRRLCHWLVVTVIVINFTNCSYNFEEDYYENFNRNEPSLAIQLTNFIASEEVGSSKTVEYTISGATTNQFNILIMVDGVRIHQNNEPSGSFYLEIDDLEIGEHFLEIEFSYATGSGSLADQLGAEFYSGEASYPFVVDDSIADPVLIESIDIINGSIHINLSAVIDDNFEEVYLLIDEAPGVVREVEITQDQLQNQLIIDTETFVDEPRFAIKTKNPFIERVGPYTLLEMEPIIFKLEPINEDSFKIVNTPHPLYGNFDQLTLRYTYPFANSISVDLNPQGGEVVVNEPYIFDENMSVPVSYRRNGDFLRSDYATLEFTTPLPFGSYSQINYSTSLDKYFLAQSDSNTINIHQLNGQTRELEQSVSLNSQGFVIKMETEPTTNNLILTTGNQESIVFNPSTFTVINVYHKNDYNRSLGYSKIWYRGNYIILEENDRRGIVEIYNINSGQLKFTGTKSNIFSSAVDASYFYINDTMYKLQSDQFVSAYTVMDTAWNTPAFFLEQMVIDVNINKAIYADYGNSTHYMDLSTGIAQRLDAYSNNPRLSFTDTGKMLIVGDFGERTGKTAVLYDPTTGIDRRINVQEGIRNEYLNGVLFSYRGYYLETELY